MFKIADVARFKWPVTIRRPSDVDAGEMVEETFTGLFRALPREESMVLLTRMREAREVDEISAIEIEQIVAVLEGWEDVVDDDGKPVPFSPEALAAANRWVWFREGISAAYGAAMKGGAARLGN